MVYQITIDPTLAKLSEEIPRLKFAVESLTPTENTYVRLINRFSRPKIKCYAYNRYSRIARNGRSWDVTVWATFKHRELKDLIEVDINVGGVLVAWIIDIGSSINIISDKLYKNYYPSQQMFLNDIRIRDAQGGIIIDEGFIHL